MKSPKPNRTEIRYGLREDGTGLWAVYDIFTGLTAEVNGIPQDGLDEVVVKFMVRELNDVYIARRKGTTH
ncbi:MAG: hypothetical protein WA950_12350 [Shinella sp.]|uniref:hypothetical protein n=1 Tax=Shinella sp. TaxID=1870904 RepID=UPI003C73D71A